MGINNVLSISKRGLYFLAAGMWIFSGVKVLSIGIHAWVLSETSWVHYIWLCVALVFFSGIIFPPVARKNISFVEGLSSGKHPLWKCFKPSSWAIMGIMMTFGILLRLSGLVPESFVAGFYCGLGISLLAVSLYYTHALRKTF